MSEFLVSPIVSLYIGAFVQWGFLMAFLYSLAISINKSDKTAVWLSLVMSLSYSSSLFIDIEQISYIQLFFFDVITIFFIIAFKYFLTKNFISLYLLLGLTVNCIFCFFVCIYDVYIFENYEPLVVLVILIQLLLTLADFMMVAIFFINKDFLALAAIKTWFHNSIMKRNNSSG